ncbi:APG12-domain-containing protein [Lindgomyces ingoldianus]|uniref:APG12-domain-containing protein n=1 Tax=Lindgomyces ingoldianus TaxID=673940 RepID=A0ACB6QQT8_9PLEO|nr:APG12-domain-containing protein [Lindgomyces ingoldianus]KAF2468531.1 APG12-domain-containing protein [Lindgomyces ingoldianus]
MSQASDSPNDRIPDEDDTAEAPLTMAASVMLTNLPRDASRALESAGTSKVSKVTIRLHPIGNAPHLTQRVFRLSSNQRFETIVRFLRKKLGVKEHESVFCYIGNVFSPSLDEGVENLWSCFKTNDELVVGYAMSPSFG